MEGGARGQLHAMVRPQHLRAVGELRRPERLLACMRGREGAVAGRVPVLGQQHMGEAGQQRIDHRHHRIAVGDRKRAAGAEVVLHVDDEEGVGCVVDLERRHGVRPVRS